MRMREAVRRALKQEIRRRERRMAKYLQQSAPLPRNRSFVVHTKQPEKWYSQGGVVVAPVEHSDPFELMRKVTTSVPEYRETHVNDRGEIVGMDWIMPDWQHFERMLDG